MQRVRFYTDGSCDNNSKVGGWSFVVCERGLIKVTKGSEINTTNNCMELLAVLRALQYAIKRKFKNVEVILDSAYVFNVLEGKVYLEWIEKKWKTTKDEDIKNKEEWTKVLHSLERLERENVKVTFTKIKAHSGISLNDRADCNAKQAMKKRMKEEENFNG